MSQMHSTFEDLEFDLLDRLHKSLRVSGMTALSLSVELGIHRNTVNNYLNGRTAPDRRTLIAWAQSTGVPLAWLESGTGPNGGPDSGGQQPVVAPAISLDALTRAKQARTGRHGSDTGRYLAAA